MLGIGIDTGGTCTDSVIFDFDRGEILASAKAATTHHRLERGIDASMGQLPEELLRRAELISLSTTLATNAAVEHKGGRVLLIFIGASEKVVRSSYREYGFEGTDFMLFVPGNAKANQPPDWEGLRSALEERLPHYDSVAISQMNADSNGGAYEKQAAELIASLRPMPVVCAYGLFQDRNVIRRGASALLNARLLPVIDDFLRAIHRCLERRGLSLPIVIMRSDGTLMSEAYAAAHPVETLLCGPAASTKGGLFLDRAEKAVILDMGGTTTDVALVKEGQLQRAKAGIQVGEWNTFVKGLAIDTFGLGGDSEVLCRQRQLSLSPRRVIPLSALAHQHPEVVEKLAKFNAEAYPVGHTLPLYTCYTLVKDIQGNPRYAQEEQALCAALENGPLTMGELASALHRDIYVLNTARLEGEGVILRSGLTPTDMMCLRGDLTLYDPAAARLAADFLARSAGVAGENLPEIIYELVERKLYGNLLRILLKDRFPGADDTFAGALERLVEDSYQTSRAGITPTDRGTLVLPAFQTDAVLVGVGAPVHVFLPRVAELLHTTCVIPKEAGVTNALGALIGDIRAVETMEIRAEYELNAQEEQKRGFTVYGGGEPRNFSEYEDALAFAMDGAKQAAREKAIRRGAKKILRVTAQEKQKSSTAYGLTLFLGAEVTGEAVGEMW